MQKTGASPPRFYKCIWAHIQSVSRELVKTEQDMCKDQEKLKQS